VPSVLDHLDELIAVATGGWATNVV